MPFAKSLSHRTVDSPNIPYVSNNSPTSTQILYAAGSADILTQITGWAQRRPGFSDTVEGTPTSFVNLQRIFQWERFDGSIYLMFCDVTASASKVYSFLSGVDATATLIYTDSASTVPFDFVSSNNTLYFSNGNVAKKWNPVDGVTNWGIAIGSQAGSAAAYAGTGANNTSIGTIDWINPTNAQGAPDGNYATATIASPATTHYLQLTNYSFAVPLANTIQGIKLEVTGHVDGTLGAQCGITAYLALDGAIIGSPISMPFSNPSDAIITFGSNSSLWGNTWSPYNVNSSTFGVFLYVSDYGLFPEDDGTAYIDSARITVYSTGAPVVSLTGTGITATTGFQYVETYGNSSTGHVSSPTAPSNLVKPANQSVLIPITASTDTQVNQIHVYRTTDSATGLGGQTYFEIPNSPVANNSATVTVTASSLTANVATFTAANNLTTSMYVTISGSTHDATFNVGPLQVASASSTQFTVPIVHANIGNAADAATVQVFILDQAPDSALNAYSIAPTPTFNDPPPNWQGMAYYSGRIWGYVDNKVWFTGLEEIITGVPEESVPSGVAGNFYAFDQPVQAIATAGIDENQKLLVFCPGRIYSINGTTLDTFRRRRIADRRGCRNRTAVAMMGGMCAWLDTASQVWATDGSSMQELSIPIRPDLLGIDQTVCSMSFHVSGNAHWLVLSTDEKLFVYDIDSEQWMPPWNFSCQYIYSAETSLGSYELLAAAPTRAVKMSLTEFNDNGTTYAPVIVTNLFSVIPDTPGVSDDPSRTGAPWYVEVDTNNFVLNDVSFLADDDPDTGVYTPLTRDKQMVAVTFNRAEGANIKQQIYPLAGRPACRWFGIKITMPDADRLDIIYGYDLAYTVVK